MIVVGGGALGAPEEVKRLAERLQAPVYSYRMGRGTLDDRHPLSITLPAAHRYWADCDVVIGIGARLQMPVQQWGTDEGMTFVRIDVDPEQLSLVRPADIGIAGRAEHVLPRLNDELDRAGPAQVQRREDIAALKAEAARGMAFLEPQLAFLRANSAALRDAGLFVARITKGG